MNKNKSTSLSAISQMTAVPLQSATTFSTIHTTNEFNSQFQHITSTLNHQREQLQSQVSMLSPNDTSLRNAGVQLAWKYEQQELIMGGQGSRQWSDMQQSEILNSGKVRGAEGHHINSVGAHPEHQANPDNIKFVENREQHLKEHNGNFQNPTEGEMIDRNERLQDINEKRIWKNEVAGIGLTAAIGLGIGFTIGTIAVLAKEGVSGKAFLRAASNGLKVGFESSTLAAINHTLVRLVGDPSVSTLTQLASNKLGLQLTENLIRAGSQMVTGIISSVVLSTWVYIKLRRQGNERAESLKKAGKMLTTSLGVLFIAVLAQGIWGGHAGIIASFSVGMVLVSYQVLKNQLDKKMMEKLSIWSIGSLKPSF